MRFAWKRGTVIIAVATSCILGGCGNGSSPTSTGPPANGSPVQTANAWFHAINAKNQTEVVSFFRHPNHFSGWGSGSPSDWPTFSNLKCAEATIPASEKTVQCTFHESAAPFAGQIDKFWNVSFSRGPNETWLIDNYGQG